MDGFSFGGCLDGVKETLDRLPPERVGKICDVLYQAYLEDRTLFIFGSGGSAALASHLACDLGREHTPSSPIRWI